MLTIRFSRIGKRKQPFFRIILSEKQRAPQSKHLEQLGHYNPRTKQAVLNVERIKHWLGRGVTVSNSVFNLLVNKRVIQSDTKRRSIVISKKRREKAVKTQEKTHGKDTAQDRAQETQQTPEAAETGQQEAPHTVATDDGSQTEELSGRNN